LKKWFESNPEKLSVKTLKKELKKRSKEIDDAQKLSEENDPLFPLKV